MARIVMPLADEFEDLEFALPFQELRQAGHSVAILGKEAKQVVAGKHRQAKVTTDCSASDVSPQGFDAMVIAGGHSPDNLRIVPDVVDFVRGFGELQRPMAVICHGPQLLIEAGLVKGWTMTSWPSVRKDLENAGANWVDQEVCVDRHLITARKPEDLPAFTEALLQKLESPSTS